MTDRDPITCHVLNTLNGRPAPGLRCTLSMRRSDPTSEQVSASKIWIFQGVTDGDGRIKTWSPTSNSGPSEEATIQNYFSTLGESAREVRTVCSIRFEAIDRWYAAQGVESFWPEVEVKFIVKGREGEEGWRHYHVPVLLGPWNYSTYRGS